MKTNIETFLSKVKYKDAINLVEYYYINYLKTLSSLPEIVDRLIDLFEWDFKSDESFDITNKTSNREYAESCKKASGILMPIIDNLIEMDVDKREFYEQIWTTINNPVVFANEIDIIGALLSLWYSNKVPYFKLEKSLEISEKKFCELFNQLYNKIQKMIFVFSRGYEYRTEIAYQLLKIINGESDERNRVVLMATTLSYFEWTLKKDDNKEDTED